jgi:2-dehydro-3-deoxygluconokinase
MGMASAEVAWKALLDTEIVHLSGITMALGPGCRHLYEEAVERARRRGVKSSIDVNYRSNLRSPEAAAEVLRPLIAQADTVFCSLRDARTLFGAGPEPGSALEALRSETRASNLVVSLGADGAIGVSGPQSVVVEGLSVEVVDRPGAGDALAAGVLNGLLSGDFEAGLRDGVVLSALTLSQDGDMVSTSREELRRYRAAGEAASIIR